MVELVVKGISNVVVYIDDLIIHSKTHEEHLALLDAVFTRLAAHNLRANLKKCVFGSSETSYLGFRLTKEGIFPGTDKLKAQQEAYDKRQRKKEKYNEVRLRGEYLCDDSDDDVTYVIAVRTPSSLQQKWSKSLQPIVTKFISVTNRHPKVSGEGKFFLLLHLLL